MQKKLLTKIIKSKINSKKDIDDLIDEFVKTQSTKAKDHLEDFLSDLFVYINKNYDKIENKSLLSIVSSKLKDLNISFDGKDIDLIYEKLSIENTIKPNVEFVFNKVDLKAIESMRNNFIWVGTEYNAKTESKLKNVIESAFKGEITREAISSKLKTEFEDIISADTRYFEGVADHIINQSQNISKVNQALKYDVEHFKVVARIDNKTSDICRSMHGKIIKADHLKNQVDNIVNAKSIGEKKGAAVWSSKPIYGKIPSNFGLAPYHFRCRTEVVPVWINEEVKLDSKTNKEYKVKSTKVASKGGLLHIDKTGVERKIKPKLYDKITQGKHGLSEKEIVGNLNSIQEIAPHGTIQGRTVAKSANGCFMVFEADEVVTMYYPSRNTKNYFKDNSQIEKKEIIKWQKENLIYGLMNMIGK